MSRFLTAVARTALIPLLVRVAVAAAGYGALLLAAPDWLRARPSAVLALLVLAALPAAAPGGSGALLVTLAAAGGWAASTDASTLSGWGHAGQVVALGTLLYLVHTLSAFAAALPYDTVVAPDVVVRWLLRASAVVAAAAGMVLLVLVVAPWALSAAGVAPVTHVGATVAGVVLALAATIALRRLLAYRRPREPGE